MPTNVTKHILPLSYKLGRLGGAAFASELEHGIVKSVVEPIITRRKPQDMRAASYNYTHAK